MNESINTFEELSNCLKYFRECGQTLDFNDSLYVDGKKVKDMSIAEIEDFLVQFRGNK
jgi:hypothetical protein